jgi:radical SAM superfamily enzyme YgiQ (UPF0313 family)
MKILLINPPFQRLKSIKVIYFPLGLGYLAAVLEQNNFDVKIYNAEIPREQTHHHGTITSLLQEHHQYIEALSNNSHPVWKEIQGVLNDYQPDIVGLSVMTAKYGSALKISGLCKEYRSDCVVVWGGPHPTVQPENVLRIPSVDFVVRGEGEATLLELSQLINQKKHKDSSSLQKVLGLSFKDKGMIIHNVSRPLLDNLDQLPYASYHLSIDLSVYRGDEMSNLLTSRGCPFNCAYCAACSICGRRVRFHSVGRVITEIKHIKDRYGVLNFNFWDDSFTVNRRRTIELCRAMIKERLNIAWNCSTRADLIDEELARIMKKAGCYNLDIGIESGSPRMLKIIRKGISLEDISKMEVVLKKYGLAWGAFFMIGFPEETRDDIQKTLDLIKDIKASSVQLGVFTPYPGTELYETTKRLGLISDDYDWSRISHQSSENYFMKEISREEFQAISFEAAKLIDAHNNSAHNILKRVKSRFLFYLQHPNLFIRKANRFLRARGMPR